MVPIAYANSEGSDEPAHPRKIACALTAHIHNRRNIDEVVCRGCEFKISKVGISRNSLCLPHICMLLHANISLRNAQSYQHLCF